MSQTRGSTHCRWTGHVCGITLLALPNTKLVVFRPTVVLPRASSTCGSAWSRRHARSMVRFNHRRCVLRLGGSSLLGEFLLWLTGFLILRNYSTYCLYYSNIVRMVRLYGITNSGFYLRHRIVQQVALWISLRTMYCGR